MELFSIRIQRTFQLVSTVKDGVPHPVSPREKVPEKKKTTRKSAGRKIS